MRPFSLNIQSKSMDISHHLVACIPTKLNEIYGSKMTALVLCLVLSNNIIIICLNITYINSQSHNIFVSN